MRLSIPAVAALGLFVSATASADPYGPAGCGLGSLIFKPDSGITQIFAATTNVTSFNQTFAISTGTLNCDSRAAGSGVKGARVFIETNREALAKDIARSQGETLASLSLLAGCQNGAGVGVALQKNFKGIFPTATVSSDKVSENVLSTLKADKSLACSI